MEPPLSLQLRVGIDVGSRCRIIFKMLNHDRPYYFET